MFVLYCTVQVVKLLLEYGSNVTDRNLGGLCAVEMAKESNINKLLEASALTQQHKGKAQSNATVVVCSYSIRDNKSFLNCKAVYLQY